MHSFETANDMAVIENSCQFDLSAAHNGFGTVEF